MKNLHAGYVSGLAMLGYGIAAPAQSPPTLLTDVGTTVPGFVIEGASAGDQIGSSSVAVIHDVNGDGLADILIGASRLDRDSLMDVGAAFLVFGKRDNSTVDLSDPGSAIRYDGVADRDGTGSSVASAGDFNGDGLGDFLIGAPPADPNGVFRGGSAFLIFGSTTLSPGTVNLADLTPTQGFRIDGFQMLRDLGSSVSGIGDFNADGFDDVLLGTPGGGGTNLRSYILFGNSGPFTSPLSMGDLVAGTAGMFLDAGDGEGFGASVAGVGDVNGDGYPDVLVGAFRTPAIAAGQTSEGSLHVFFGGPNVPSIFSTNDFDGSNGFSVFASAADGQFGRVVSSAGDVNGDGYADMLAKAPFIQLGDGDFAEGLTYLIYGRAQFPADLDENGPETSVVSWRGPDGQDRFGFGLAPGGDWNRDGLGDFVVHGGEGFNGIGNVYPTFGTTGAPPVLASAGTFQSATTFSGAGDSLGGGHDVNGDGIADIAISADSESPGDPARLGAGRIYVLTGLATDAIGSTPYTYRAFLPPDRTMTLPIGSLGASSTLEAQSRFRLGFDNGTGTGTNDSSLVEITFDPAADFGGSIPQGAFEPIGSTFTISSNREGWSTYDFLYRYTDAEADVLVEEILQLYFLNPGRVEWERVEGAVFDNTRNTVRATGQPLLGTYALGNPKASDFPTGWVTE